ncbi:hypothetical protein [Euzebya sp.]|uniref:hypothetical protein n=1 Tax=Euzebya sp. TaxID=1971409 RepID=UPI00351322E9
MSIHTCTRCPLRFTNRAELADHMEHDHHVPHALLEQMAYPGVHAAEPLYRSLAGDDGVQTILLLANQGIGSDALREVMADRVASHDRVAVFVVVPATPSAHLASAPGGGRLASPDRGLRDRTDDVGVAQARFRLRTAIEILRDLGIAAHGRVADPNPVVAASRAIADEPIDEIVLTTLSPDMSQWLHADLPALLARRFELPVHTITAETSHT